MYIKSLLSSPEFIAGDSTILREILHPDKDDVAIGYSLAHARVEPGKSSMKHQLRSSEVYFILAGEGRMHINEETEIVRAGQLVFIPPHATQYIENIGGVDLKFLCIVEPAWKIEDEITHPLAPSL